MREAYPTLLLSVNEPQSDSATLCLASARSLCYSTAAARRSSGRPRYLWQ